MEEKLLIDVMKPLSSLLPFHNREELRRGCKQYINYLRDLQIRLYQRGETSPNKWVIVGIKKHTSEPIFINEEIGEEIKRIQREGDDEENESKVVDIYTFKTNIADINKLIKTLQRLRA